MTDLPTGPTLTDERRLLDPSDALIRATVEMSQRFGRDPEYSRGGGGNSSLKAGGVVYIKPSGVPLATLEADDLVPLDMAPLLDLLHGRAGEAAEARLPGAPDPVMRAAARVRLAEARGRRPSVELMFHSLIPERFVRFRKKVANPTSGVQKLCKKSMIPVSLIA